jgi:hypothetical protein
VHCLRAIGPRSDYNASFLAAQADRH